MAGARRESLPGIPSNVVHAIRQTAELFDTPTQAVIGTTISGVIVFWNSHAERMYGWREPEVLGKQIIDVTPSDITREAAEEIMQRLAQGIGWSGEFRVRNKFGEEFFAYVNDLPVQSADGKLVGVVGTSTPAGKTDRP